ncbi:ABC transporter permease [Nocardioides KLBMP 9356]|uniref:ABC transporter permease n=2 Tax=Nocardioides potassii TaxID=2911371 RepID=A0ABS9HG65_9ACTN|nr:ABC transporter permease [Nocardioides potassii]
MVLAQARMEARLMLRNGEQLLLAVVIPVIVLVGGVAGADRLGLDLQGHRPVDVLTPGVLALAVMSTAFTSVAIATGFERRYGVIKLLGASPLPRHGLLLGKVVALLNVVALQLVVLVVVGLALGWRPALDHPPTSALGLVLAVAVGTAAFAALGLFVAGVLRAEATLALANLVYLLLMAGGGVVLPTSTYGSAGSVIQWLPSAALGDAMRAALVDAAVDGRSLLVLAVWAALGTALTARTFRWE